MKRKLITASILLVILISLSTATYSSTANPVRPLSDSLFKGSKKKKDVVKLYPNPTSTGKITISSTTPDVLHVYVFELDGTLLHQVVLKEKGKHAIENLKKGTYVYDVFLNDESIEHGEIIAK